MSDDNGMKKYWEDLKSSGPAAQPLGQDQNECVSLGQKGTPFWFANETTKEATHKGPPYTDAARLAARPTYITDTITNQFKFQAAPVISAACSVLAVFPRPCGMFPAFLQWTLFLR